MEKGKAPVMYITAVRMLFLTITACLQGDYVPRGDRQDEWSLNFARVVLLFRLTSVSGRDLSEPAAAAGGGGSAMPAHENYQHYTPCQAAAKVKAVCGGCPSVSFMLCQYFDQVRFSFHFLLSFS